MDDNGCSELLAPAQRRTLARRLIGWFGREGRDLPWRRTRDLYAIWVSEVMLQQTQVATVIPYFERFLRAFPDVAALAAAEEEQVLMHWEGLGYYRRARQLHAAARQVVALHGGRFPAEYDQVRSLPGIGRYTAGAILSIGLDARLPILEANTIRVLSRLSAYRGNPLSPAGQKHLWSLAEAILPARNVGVFNQALMELGSETCTVKAPACDRCPVREHCRAFAEEAQHQIPLAPRKTKYEDVAEIALIVRRGRRVLVCKCQPGERWAGLWDFPRVRRTDFQSVREKVLKLTDLTISLGKRLATLKHGVTRFRITLDVYEAALAPFPRQRPRPLAKAEVRWATPVELAGLPLSTTGRKIARLLVGGVIPTPHTSPAAAVRRGRSRHTPG